MEAVHFFKFRASLPVDLLDMAAAPHPRFPVAGSHTEHWWRCCKYIPSKTKQKQQLVGCRN
jgi:hypothetical protein